MPLPKNGFSGQYGAQSKISPEKSRDAIELMLTRYGADGFQYAIDHAAGRVAISFRVHQRVVRLVIELPDPNAPAFTKTRKGREWDAIGRNYTSPGRKAYERIVRQRWRVLVISVRAKLEAILCGVSTFDTEFLGNIVVPGGKTLAEWATPQLDAAYASNVTLPALTPSGAAEIADGVDTARATGARRLDAAEFISHA